MADKIIDIPEIEAIEVLSALALYDSQTLAAVQMFAAGADERVAELDEVTRLAAINQVFAIRSPERATLLAQVQQMQAQLA